MSIKIKTHFNYKYTLLFGCLILLLAWSSCTNDSPPSAETKEKKVKVIGAEPKAVETTSKSPEVVENNDPKRKKPAPLGRGKSRLKMQNDMYNAHEKLMKQMESTGELSEQEVVKYAKDSELYMSVYGDSLAAEYAFNAADLYRGIGDYKRALDMWLLVYKAYERDHPKAPHALFQCAFTYDTVLDRKDLAKTLYTSFLKKYPNHNLAKDAQLSLKNVDKSPEDLIKEFQKKNQN